MYKKGDIVEGKVTGIEEYGIFISLDNEYNGLIHISEITQGYVTNPNKYVNIGDNIYVYILDVNEKEKQLILSIKNINYKYNDEKALVKESIRGFLPLHEKLKEWTTEKLEELDK
ncbi:MAG: S1 RNA-binding domain-containing protein [Bacilli bacterium]|nr:S1 RNA-binding domain-containing protein [Bacilli bacterium]MDD3895937.1 S1 RNA-binding domain-containing protein [Bacilli bacterium]MDD4408159.1 S1 RNA-binding domain-containing protein [Bacilli bacterium]